MRQVGGAELEWNIVMALSRCGPALYGQLLSREPAKATQAEAMLARQIAAGLSRYEILTNAPAPQNEQTFAVPIARMMGEVMPSGLPPVDERER